MRMRLLPSLLRHRKSLLALLRVSTSRHNKSLTIVATTPLYPIVGLAGDDSVYVFNFFEPRARAILMLAFQKGLLSVIPAKKCECVR
jgi:hypothetical protein